jgi:hypothetical protein
MRFERDHLLGDLKVHVCEIHFTKVNGEFRKMRCTLRNDLLPSNTDMAHLDEEHKKEPNLSTIVAWDVEKNGWRSFRIDTVQYAQVIEAY